jgi:hypothetical protein
VLGKLSLFQKSFPAGQVVLGANVRTEETANNSMYTVVVQAYDPSPFVKYEMDGPFKAEERR